MKNTWIIKTSAAFALIALILSGSVSCTIKQQEDLNFPSVNEIESDASIAELNNVVAGMLGGMRLSFDTYIDDCAIIGRDYYRFSSADPRFTTDLPGVPPASLDNNTFYIINPWGMFYRVIRDGWVLRHAVDNTTATLTTEEKNGYYGFAKTMQALEFHYALNMTYNNGIRVEVEDPDALGDIVSKDQALVFIADLLDEAYSDLTNGGDHFVLELTSGFAGFTTPADFAKFNRALKARIDVYQENFSGALSDLNNSFIDEAGDLYTGTYITYSTGSGDVPNPLFKAIPNQESDARVAQNLWVTQAEPGDLRLSKVVQRPSAATGGTFSSNYDVNVWPSDNAWVSIIRNEELILIRAEAKILTGDLTGGVNDLNLIRAAAGLAPYSGATDQASLTAEMLNQRRYSLFAEGHRWIDMRRYGMLDQIETDDPAEIVWEAFPIPANEPL